MSTANIENIDPAVEAVERPGRIFIIDYKFDLKTAATPNQFQ